ncbi:MAG TPA: PQQ-binding-like beta-propeller repeat protein [Caulobacteraceae bacterium]|jgi:alcohol dehydrogenase (cytochrome c)|nr:PQQ-binding-like beta-propeller repeat protein [Caulobacteraceae bacterium]
MIRFSLGALAALALAPALALAQDEPPAPPPPPAAAPGAPPRPIQTNSLTGGPTKDTSPVTDAMLKAPPPGEWLMWRRNFAAWGYSPLDQVNVGNVKNLQLVWSRGTTAGRQEGTPLVHDGIMYFPEPTDAIMAVDARTGDLLWEYKRAIPGDIRNFIRNIDDHRSIAIWENLIISNSVDDHVVALDAKTGKLVWETAFADYREHPALQSAGPIVAGGKVISTRGCDPRGGPLACVITAYDARTGKELWRFHTVPQPGEPGYDSWGKVPYEQRWHVGAWMTPSFDPDTNLVYVGTSVTSPAPKFALDGNDKQYLYNNSTLAIDATTGKLAWYYQHVVDNWDMDHTMERMIVDTAVAPDPKEVTWINPRLKPGEKRRVITGIPGKTGVIYTLDAKTGEFLWGRATIRQNMVQSIDGATGKVTVNPDVLFNKVGDTRFICPTPAGGRNWPAGAFSPMTGLMYFPMQNTCQNMTAVLDRPSLASAYGIRGETEMAPGETNLGTIQAYSAATGKLAWKHDQRAGVLSLVATGGGLIFVGDLAGRFKALDHKTGKVVWEVNLGSAVSGFPITYAVNGKQYVVASTGASNPVGLLSLTPEIKSRVDNNIFVFALPDGVR